MAGGLLQLVSYGIQNKYLTKDPQITFFKIVYRRHTHFGKENVLLNYDQGVDLDKKLSFTVPNNGDLLSNITLHFNFESFYPNINSISSNILILLENEISNLKEELSFLNSQRENLKIYSNIIFGLIKIIEKYQNTLNINLSLIINLVSSYQKKVITDFNNIKDLIPTKILQNSNLFKFILEDNIYKTIDELIISKDNIKKYLIKQMNILNNRIILKEKKIKEKENYPIFYKWKRNLVNLLVDQIELEIDGEIIDRITKEELEIYYQHHYTIDEKQKYNIMFNGKEYSDFDLYLPLNLWFKESYGLGLPIVSLRYSTIKLNITLNKMENLYDLFLFDNEYEKMLNLDFEYENISYQVYGDLVQIENEIYNISNTKLDLGTNILSVKSNFIYKNNLIENLDIDDDSADKILNTFGSKKNEVELSLDKNEYRNFVLNFKSIDIATLPLKYNVNRFNLSSNYTLNNADIYCEYIYLDQIEREKFASHRLNYLIKLHTSNNFNIVDNYFNKNLDIENYVTDIFWYLQYESELLGNNIESPRYYNLLTNDKIKNFQLMLDQYSLFHKQNAPEYFNQVLPYQYLNSEFINNYFYYPFCLYPEENQPSGGLSFGDLGGKQFIVNLNNLNVSENNKIKLNIYFRKLSILTISNGKGKLAFYSKN